VWSIFKDSLRPLSPAEVYSEAIKSMPQLSLATIYRAVRSLQEDNRVVAVALPGEPDRYETKFRSELHHHHFHCDSCGRVFDVPGCGLHIENDAHHGFKVIRHEVMLYGECRECLG
jgi:Fur family ferric uptake transcriptional regulator